MTQILKNKDLEIHTDLPSKGYRQTRFDWTGKIVKVKFHDVLVSSTEHMNESDKDGKGFYNEFGIESPLGYEEAAAKGWFHKIGVGLLKRDENPYLFSKQYQLKPLDFEVNTEPNKITIHCQSKLVNGYAYRLKKEIELFENTWQIRYHLQNTGEKTIQTDEYNHNFIAINKELIGSYYVLQFPFELKPASFIEIVNPDRKVAIGQRTFRFKGSHTQPFFFSNLSGGETVNAAWKLTNFSSKISISETASFQTRKVNLWGWEHVVSPELFFEICIQAGESVQWSRTYRVETMR